MTTSTPNSTAQDTTNAAKVEDKIYPDSKTPKADSATAPKEEVVPVEGDKPAGDKPADSKPAGDEPAKAPEDQAAPAEFKLELPKDSILDPARVEVVTSFAKEKGLNPEQAQAILNNESALAASLMQQQKQKYEAQLSKWKADVLADPEIGGTGFKETAHLAKQVAERFGTPEFLVELEKTGLGNHPELVRVFSRIGKAMDNDKLVRPGSANAAGQKSHADVLYPSGKN